MFALSSLADVPEWKSIHEPLLNAIKLGNSAVSALALQYKTKIIVYTNTRGEFQKSIEVRPEGIKRVVCLIICSTGGTSWSFTE
jgi:hypothetical protein